MHISDTPIERCSARYHGRLKAVSDKAGFSFDALCENFDRWAARDGESEAVSLLVAKEAELRLGETSA